MASGTNKIPAGLELVYSLEKENVRNALDAFLLSLHWSIIRTGLRQRSPSAPNEFTERLPPDWHQPQDGGATRTLTQTYLDPQSSRLKYELKVIELTSNDLVAVTFFRSPNTAAGASETSSTGGGGSAGSSAAATANRPASDKSSGTEKNSAASTFQIGSFIKAGAFQEGQSRNKATDIYEHADTLETQLYESIMEPLGLRVMGQPPVQGPYDDSTTTKPAERPRPQREQNPLAADDRFYQPEFGRRPSPLGPGFPGGLGGPLYVPPMGGPGGLGRNDLDPLGGFGAGNIMDPRGFRTPRAGMPGLFPGSNPPGARFDPFGPPNPSRPNGGTGNFAIPNPDHERPPSSDYDDMFM